MSDLFVSYRRGGAAGGDSQTLASDLGQHFGAERVYRDAGSGSFDATEAAARACRTMLAVIGERWLARVGELGDPADWVRRELGIAFERRVPVFVVLVDGVRKERLQELDLGAPLDALLRQPAHELLREDWKASVDRLVASLRQVPGLER